jgi:hypothetical protein
LRRKLITGSAAKSDQVFHEFGVKETDTKVTKPSFPREMWKVNWVEGGLDQVMTTKTGEG